MAYRVEYLQAVEPDELPKRRGVHVVVVEDEDSMGFPRVTVVAPSREALLDYCREAWGDSDADWFREYVEDRVEETKRAVLVMARVEVPDSDHRDADDIATDVREALEVSASFGYFDGNPDKPTVSRIDGMEVV